MPDDRDGRLKLIEQRLRAIEARLGLEPPRPPSIPLPVPSQPPSTKAQAQPTSAPSMAQASPSAKISPTVILGWGGVASLVLAAAYLLRLAIDSGFLTPIRQVGLAGIFGVGLIAAGMFLKDSLRRYGSLLPAGGVTVLFLTVYGAHLYHRLFGAFPAAVGVIVICIVSLGLRAFYENELFTFFAVIGAYTGPLLLHVLAARPLDVVIYFGAWDLLFCLYAIRAQRRSVYLLAAYLAFVVFDATWRMAEQSDWMWAAGFQAAQFLIFLGATVWFSVEHRSPLKKNEPLLHLPPLLFFYATEYGLLSRYIPETAPWLAIVSIVPLAVAYLIARSRLPEEAPAGELIVSAYTAIALFHAGYMKLIPAGWREMAGLLALIVLAVSKARFLPMLRRFWPMTLMVGVVAFLSYARLTIGYDLEKVVAWQALIPLYAASLYVAYWFLLNTAREGFLADAVLYFGHLTVLAGIVHLSDSRLLVSIVWGIAAVVTLVISMLTADRRMGRSALLVFAVFAAKVLLFDLSGASPLVRIGCLVVLGVTMYVGGIL